MEKYTEIIFVTFHCESYARAVRPLNALLASIAPMEASVSQKINIIFRNND